ncbi:MAG TPA: response regulator [Gemmatimonadales bacterium]|nr:response regulator [Gemmatimonadales bacterium]
MPEQHGGPPAPHNGDTSLLLPGRGELILVVDDDEKLVKALARMLRSLGFAVLTALDGEEALALTRGSSTPIDVVLADIVMPKLGGKEFADRLASEGIRAPVIYMSGYDDPAKMAPVLKTGAPLLHKPFTLHALVVVLRSALDKRSGGNH